jgi:hypothetical protein
MFVTESEGVATAPLAFPPREAGPPAVVASSCPRVGRERPAKVNRGLLEHLGGDLLPPPEASDLLGEGTVWSCDEDTSGGLTAFPLIEGVDQVEPRPWDFDLRLYPFGGKGIDDQPKTLVVGEPGRSGMSRKHCSLRRRGSKREPERGISHSVEERT